MDRISISAAAESASSTNYDTSLLLGQESPVGSVSFCNLGFVSTLGFWSVRGNSVVPVQLIVDKLSLDPLVVGLAWSGNEPEFEVYRGISPDDLLHPLNLQVVTPMCSISDETAQAPDLLFYEVIPRP